MNMRLLYYLLHHEEETSSLKGYGLQLAVFNSLALEIIVSAIDVIAVEGIVSATTLFKSLLTFLASIVTAFFFGRYAVD